MKVMLYIAQSLDGFVASTDGSVSWLDEFNSGEDYGYQTFIESVDTVVQGNTTYRQFEDKHSGKNSYVFTRDVHRQVTEGITYVEGSPKSFIDSLDKSTHKHIWLVGGPQILAHFLNEKQVDEMIIFTMPVLLRSGIPLFRDIQTTSFLHLHDVEKYNNGVVRTHYKIT